MFLQFYAFCFWGNCEVYCFLDFFVKMSAVWTWEIIDSFVCDFCILLLCWKYKLAIEVFLMVSFGFLRIKAYHLYIKLFWLFLFLYVSLQTHSNFFFIFLPKIWSAIFKRHEKIGSSCYRHASIWDILVSSVYYYAGSGHAIDSLYGCWDVTLITLLCPQLI